MMTTGKENRPDQKATIERLLEDEQVLVHVNPNAAGVMIPNHLRDSRTVTLRLSRYFKGDLFTDDEKVTAELLFGSAYYTCVLPWSSMWGASSMREEEYLWPEAAPEDILELALSQQQKQPTSRPLPSAEPTPGKAGKPRASGSHLRRVK